ncbi:MAG TPA: fibronectin type III domain-containing protein [Solirubrobacteraceae bacterium]
MPPKRRGWILAVIAVLSASLLGTSLALAATQPAATTSPATNVTSTTATLNGTVTPNKTATSYHFEYGRTTSLGTNTAPATVSGNATKTVSTDVTGLLPATKYYFRIMAVSSAGTAVGSEMSFTTALVGVPPTKNTVSINSIPHVITWGHTAAIAGSVTGPDKAGKKVVLLANPAPYTLGFKPTGATTTTATNGSYSLTVKPGRNTRYEVVVSTKVPVTSSAVSVGVRVKVVIHVSTLHPLKGQLVKFSGTVTPAHNGRYALIQRRTSTGIWKTVASTRLFAGGLVNGVAVSKYARKIRIFHTGTYRVQVNPRDGNHLTGNSATRTELVH